MKSVFVAIPALILTMSSFAQADLVIRCNQTEPFITELFFLQTGEAITTSPGEKTRVEKGLDYRGDGAGTVTILTKEGKVRRVLNFNATGSDGMSDTEYAIDGGQGINGPIGCESLNSKDL